ncbi:hypothetical protein CBR_g34389 [Chara braunii]|uniref:Uncharacterized protein n=1 Tax=Chara braunii TaxID=69332 RepID=A0A388LIG2_CHABU|nr:hypothetical protein CBR_g34389 [Chara braunii]|eukprot:GBG82108.1 hypothetical protein CBR_g34389 [Chara braunii]
MGECSGEPELRIVPKFERKDDYVLVGACTSDLLINLHPVEPWVIFAPNWFALQVWNYDDGTQVALWELPVAQGALEAQFITQNNWIVVKEFNSLAIYDKQGSKLQRIKALMGKTDESYPLSMAVHPTLPYLMAGFGDDNFFLWYWGEGWEKSEKVVLRGHSGCVRQVVFHPIESHIFASAGGEGTIKVWNLEDASVIRTLEGDESDVRKTASEIGFGNGLHKSLMISLHCNKRCVYVWDYESGACVAKWDAHEEKCESAFFHPHLPYIFTAAEDGEVKVWSDSNYQQVSSYFCPWEGELQRMRPCGKSNMLVLGGGGEFRAEKVVTRGEEKDNKKEPEQKEFEILAERPRIEPKNEFADSVANSLSLRRRLSTGCVADGSRGDLLGFLFGAIRPGCRRRLTQELTVPIAQLADHLDVSIVSQVDPRLVPHVTSRTLSPYLQWSACVEGFPSRIPPSRLDYLDPRNIVDPAFYRPPCEDELEEIIREELAEESSEEEEENPNEDEGEPAQHQGGAEDELLQTESEEEAEEEDNEQGSGDDNDEEKANKDPQLKIVPVADLPISNDPTLDPEPPQPDDGHVAQVAGPSARRPPSPPRLLIGFDAIEDDTAFKNALDFNAGCWGVDL